MRCLVIDDNSDDRSLVERMLRKSGHRATCVDTAAAALEALGRESFDVAIVDLGLPGESGVSALRRMRARDPNLRLLVVSGFDDRAHILGALDAGASGYILKTEVSARLGEALQEVIAGDSPLSGRVGAVLLRAFVGRSAAGSSPPTIEKARTKLADASGEIVRGKADLPKSSGD